MSRKTDNFSLAVWTILVCKYPAHAYAIDVALYHRILGWPRSHATKENLS